MKNMRNLAIGFVALLGICVVIGMLAGDDEPQTAEAPAVPTTAPGQPTSTTGPTAEPTPAPTLMAWAELKAWRETATDVQWDAFAASSPGSVIVDWPATVHDVEAKGGAYEVRVDFDNEDFLPLSDCNILTDGEIALQLKKDDRVFVTGVVREVESAGGSITGLELEPNAEIRLP